MKRIRTFIAIDLSDAVRRAADQVMTQMSPCAPSAKIHWVARDLMHITLKFVGNVDESELPAVCQAVRAACAGTKPFELHCRGLSAFPVPERARTIWLGIEGDGVAALRHVQTQLEANLSDAGFPREVRRYEPHVTIGRVRGNRGCFEIAQQLSQYSAYDAGRFVVQRLTTYASRLARGGPTYMPLSRVCLSATTEAPQI